jgi:hypothetical protein
LIDKLIDKNDARVRIRSIGREGGGDPKPGWFPHLPAHVHNRADLEQRGSEGGTGTPNSRIRLDLSALAGTPKKRLAQSKLVWMVLNKGDALA